MDNWNWRQSPELIHRLLKAQVALNQPVDVMTMAVHCHTRQELEAHVTDCEKQVNKQARRGDQRRLAVTLFLAMQGAA